MSASSQDSLAAAPAQTTNQPHTPSRLSGWRVPNPLATLDPIFKRDEADILFIAGTVALIAFDLIEWPIAALMLASHTMARSRHKVLHSDSRSSRGSRVSALAARSLGSTGRKQSCSGKSQASSENTYSA